MHSVAPGSPAQIQFQELRERTRRYQLARVLLVTERMLAYAQKGQWHEVEALEVQRGQGMAECFGLEGGAMSDEMAEALASLLDLNGQLVTLVRHARCQLDVEHRLQRRSRNAAQAYSGTGP